ncbi:gamma-glutamylcyclotransferase [uncultured Shimia sp.]|uniref:gamma-glutamylcyclotransferase n=1 Tax=uncultured Shimia sp. TaxID=573152 RepID=UPI0026160D09|nr:gamma-glutamylcyclotransferase [uncultured Shimia sp.]
MTDPFRHHPSLRSLITPPEESELRDFDPASIEEIVLANGASKTWKLSDEAREADRVQALKGREEQDIWVFAYGSLIWNPAFRFAEVRRAFAPEVERKFILRDIYGGRGTRDVPGVMAALEHGHGCHGLVFRIRAEEQVEETRILWRRERVGDAYIPSFLRAGTDHGPVEALAFMANHDAELIAPDLSHDDQVRFCATGQGWLGSSFDYVANLATHFEELRIEDQGVTRLLADARAWKGRHVL